MSAGLGSRRGGATRVRVASVPHSHVYVRHLSPLNGTVSGLDSGPVSVVRLPDPVPADGAKVPGGWWPPLMLDPAWIARNHNEFDVFHLHFGFDAVEPAEMSKVIDELRTHGKPLVYTLHDLRNPHHPEPGRHEEVLDILVPAADEVITLTPGVSREIARRWQRKATVLPHPHVVPPGRFGPRAPHADDFVVGVHAKSIRANMDPLPVIMTLLEAAADYPDMTVQINLHDEVFVPGKHAYNPDFGTTALALSRHPYARVLVHEYFSDDQLWDYLRSVDVSVLPYRFGTHSGWLEACHDLGTTVIAPSCGFYREQQDCLSFEFTEDTFDPDSLVSALAQAYSARPAAASWPDRRAQRESLAEQHAALYTRALDA
ncbi:glycosyltransferase [Gordonia hongkongensis]|uniref:glycosyltransferase n=1 Tax=Gordonia hongkongensis TaxID=1701090 RepID=UPI001FFB6CBD|nr:glycosyltransferase [Gordonia hongkongensis]UPG67812.1 glycosyltransferase [Gordonia hongkongensis]